MSTATKSGRLSTLSAALVMARRDFTAILLSRSFIFFLLAPFFPVVVAMVAGGIGQRVQQEAAPIELGLVMQAKDSAAMVAARDRLSGSVPLPRLRVLRTAEPGERVDAAAELKRSSAAAVLSGTPADPVLTGPGERIAVWQGSVALIAATARQRETVTLPEVRAELTQTSNAESRQDRSGTAQGGQTLLFLLTMILAGMVLSNLVEEKGNKIIEVLAAAIPMEAVFLGKLFAMLGVSLVAIAVWTAVGSAVLLGGAALPDLAAPAVGWPAFLLLGIAYFAMAYLLLGAVFLAIGSMAATVRDVQSLSFPVTMLQLVVFLFSTYAATQGDKPVAIVAAVIPFCSPFMMLARAATEAALWPHLAALAWQALWVVICVRTGARLFKTRVMKSGGGAKRGWFTRKRAARS